MIREYALEPELVATWGSQQQYRYFLREFGIAQGRLVSRFPKRWARKVWDAFGGKNDLEKKRLEELLIHLQSTMVKREGTAWDDNQTAWLDNAVREHTRYPFQAILARDNPGNRPEILVEENLNRSTCPQWEMPHSRIVPRTAEAMASAVASMLACCRWVRFIDPYISSCKKQHLRSMEAFFKILVDKRPVGPANQIEVHTKAEGASRDYLLKFYRQIAPAGLQITMYLWRERANGQRLHNRYILTDLGGVSFQHGLDCGRDGETDDLARLDSDQYSIRCEQYRPETQAFEAASAPIEIRV